MNTKKITWTAIGIALYVALSMVCKIPLISHISLDLGYIALAVYAVYLGPLAAIVGGVGCMLVSLLTTGMFPPGWILGNIFIGFFCGLYWHKSNYYLADCFFGVIATFIGIVDIKTIVECLMFSIPLAVKIPKNATAFVADSIVLIIGYVVAQILKNRKKPSYA